MQMRRCKHCKKGLPLGCFRPIIDRQGKTLKSTVCKRCQNILISGNTIAAGSRNKPYKGVYTTKYEDAYGNTVIVLPPSAGVFY